jgi:hypothetical protein
MATVVKRRHHQAADVAHTRAHDAVQVRRHGHQVLVTRVGLHLPPSLTYDDWESAGKRISAVADSSAWCLGDWVIFGQHRYTDRYKQAIEAAGLDYQTIRNYVWVARSFELSRRRPGLSFQHHAEVAALPPHEQDRWLQNAEKHGWSRNQLRQYVRASRAAGKEPPLAQPLPRLCLDPGQIDRWRTAATISNCSFESWIVEQLDAAASQIIAG